MTEIFQNLTEEQRPQAAHIWNVVFNDGVPDEDGPGGHQDPWPDRAYVFGCLVDDRVVSVVHLMRREAHVPGGKWTFGAIAGVATLEEFRGRGYSSKLLRMAAEQMKADGCDIGLLFTGINPFYEKLGWSTVLRKHLVFSVDTPPAPAIEPATAVEWAEIAPVHEAFNRDRPFTVVRPPEYWEKWASGWLRGTRWLLIREGSKLVAYAAVRKDAVKLTLWECGWLPGHREAPLALTRELMALAGAWGRKTIEGTAPDEPSLLQGLARFGKRLDHAPDDGLMALPIHRSEEEVKKLCQTVTWETGGYWMSDCF